MYVAIGSDGRRPVVWGMGSTEMLALQDAREQLTEAGNESDVEALRMVVVDDLRAASISKGDVDASDL